MEPIAAPLLQWFNANKRLLPFRQEPSAYHIWVSEIMLQQTRVAAAIPYYERFIAALPNPAALAACEPDALRKLWQGLGYYNRVNRRICQYFIVRSVSMYSVFLGKLSFFRVNIVNAGKRGNVARKYLPCVPAALTAVAYNRKILFHKGYHSSIFLILGQSISLR